ncbi:MAG TPA: Lrp/AsnC family transcriptional regulator [Candidatus Nanoarchaeia archaeon]|nr:Lrp/AsnC family transcriptional regulator [Candidatus Nanoarchaeia archaeon]
MMMDDTDTKIIKILKLNAKSTVSQISRKTALPITTVHNRIKKLERNGVIKTYVPVLDYKKLGLSVSAYILVNVDYRYLKEKGLSQYDLASKIKSYNGVEEVAMVTGTSDIILKMRTESVEALSDFVTIQLRAIEGVEKTQTALILNEV